MTKFQRENCVKQSLNQSIFLWMLTLGTTKFVLPLIYRYSYELFF